MHDLDPSTPLRTAGGDCKWWLPADRVDGKVGRRLALLHISDDDGVAPATCGKLIHFGDWGSREMIFTFQ
jgi:hypothetical protein